VDIVMIPGLWLNGSSWQPVVPALEAAGLRAHPLTLRGMDAPASDRSQVSLEDHVAGVVEGIDRCAQGSKVVLVGHSAGCGVAYAALDRRVDRVHRMVYVGGFPTPDGSAVAEGFETAGGDLPMPDLAEFGEEDLADMDASARVAFRASAIPSPARLAIDRVRLRNPRRYDVPVTAVCTEYSSDMLKEWIAAGEESVQEFARIRDLDFIDLPTGHWPQITRPIDLGNVILTALGKQS
jgi:pimeloyl-ACP methyl ester carboxylesterase